MRVLFIVNPVAGKGQAMKKVPFIKDAMKNIEGVEYEISYTKRPGHATEIAKDAADDGYDIVYAVGGDGTVNEVMNGLVGKDSALAVLPGGSGNDFIRSLTSYRIDHTKIRDTIFGTKKTIDIGIINGRYFINIASVGFDAEVVLATQQFKKLLLSGSTAYIAGLIKTIFTGKMNKVKIKLDGQELEKRILLIAVANGKYYGGGMKAAPYADIDDGLFDICIIESLPKIKLLFLFPQFIKGKHKKFKEVSFYKSKSVRIESQDLIGVNIDGEVFKDNCASFEIAKEKLYVMIPN